jgi:flavin-dependent dehydrogenase
MEPIEIVGGGLAGLSLGVALRRAEVPVTLFDAGTFPRHRVCGEFIAGLDAATIATLQLREFVVGAAEHREVAWVTPDGQSQVHQLPSSAYGISRYELDSRLANAFVAAGGCLHTGSRITDLRPRARRILATGRRRAGGKWLGLKIHAIGLRLDADLEVHLGDHAYVGLSRVEGDRVNICGLFRRSAKVSRAESAAPAASSASHGDAGRTRVLFDYLARAGLCGLADRLRAASLDPDSFCSVAALGFDRAVPRQNEIRIGDACAMTPPFTGNGMAMAFQSAAISLEPLTRYARDEVTWETASAAINRGLTRRFRTRLFTADLLHPFLLRPRRQHTLAALGRAGLLPFRPLFAALH